MLLKWYLPSSGSFFCLPSVRFSKEQEKPGFMAESANGFLTSHIFSEIEPTEIEEQEHPATKLWCRDCSCHVGKLKLLNLSASLSTAWAAPQHKPLSTKCVCMGVPTFRGRQALLNLFMKLLYIY